MSGKLDAGTASRLSRCIAGAIGELNSIRAQDQQLPTDDGTLRLVGDGGALDSLGFVNFVVSLETALQAEFGPETTVMAELLAAPDPSEFATVSALTTFVSSRIADA